MRIYFFKAGNINLVISDRLLIESATMKNSLLLIVLASFLLFASAIGCYKPAPSVQTSNTPTQSELQQKLSSHRYAELSTGGFDFGHSTNLYSASLVGLVRTGEDLSGILRFKPLGSDKWVDVPQGLIKKRDHLNNLDENGQAYEEVRLHIAGQQEQTEQLFSLLGWNEIQDYVTLVGVVESNDYSGGLGGDGDWLLKVRPDPGYERLLVNRAGHRNSDGLIECEIEPTAGSFDNENNARAYFGRIRGKRVTIIGTWVEDKSHKDKTEIHPITAISSRDGNTVHIFAFTDDSDNFPAKVPHSEENRKVEMSVPVDPSHNSFSIIEERYRARSHSIGIVGGASGKRLVAKIETGTPDEGRGYYYAQLMLTTGPPHGGDLPPPPRGHYLEIKFLDDTGMRGGEMFLQKDNNNYRERTLGANLSPSELAQVCAGLAEELGMRYVLRGDTIKLYAPQPWPRFVCDPGVFSYRSGTD